MSIGGLLAFLVLVAVFVLWLTERLAGIEAGLSGGLAAAILLAPYPIAWKPGG